MSLALTTDILLQSVGKRVKNAQDQYLGEIIEITRDAAGEFIEYAILKTDEMFSEKGRYFAIPVSSSLIKITEAGEIILMISVDQLDQANEIKANQCPSPDFNMTPSIFQLFDYKAPAINASNPSQEIL